MLTTQEFKFLKLFYDDSVSVSFVKRLYYKTRKRFSPGFIKRKADSIVAGAGTYVCNKLIADNMLEPHQNIERIKTNSGTLHVGHQRLLITDKGQAAVIDYMDIRRSKRVEFIADHIFTFIGGFLAGASTTLLCTWIISRW